MVPPKRLRHIGTFACRRIRTYPNYLSEHALGNAIDIEGFEFGPLDRRARERVPRALWRPFAVTVLKHWRGGDIEGRDPASVHARFLHTRSDNVHEVTVQPVGRVAIDADLRLGKIALRLPRHPHVTRLHSRRLTDDQALGLLWPREIHSHARGFRIFDVFDAELCVVIRI